MPQELPTPLLFKKLEELQKAYMEEVNAILGGQEDPLTRANLVAEMDRLTMKLTDAMLNLATILYKDAGLTLA